MAKKKSALTPLKTPKAQAKYLQAIVKTKAEHGAIATSKVLTTACTDKGIAISVDASNGDGNEAYNRIDSSQKPSKGNHAADVSDSESEG